MPYSRYVASASRSLWSFVFGVLGFVGTASADILLVDSGLNSVVRLSETDGSVIDANFITGLTSGTPKSIVASNRNTLLLANQLDATIDEYSFSGQFLSRLIAGSAEYNNFRSIAVRDNGLFVAVGGGTLEDTIQRFDLTTLQRSTFIDSTGGQVGSPWDITFRGDNVFVSSGDLGRVQQFDLSGNLQRSINAASPRQISFAADGDLLIAQSTAGGGVLRFDPVTNTGVAFGGDVAPQGVIELNNGVVIYGGGNRFGRFDPATNAASFTIQSGSSFQYLTRVDLTAVPEPSSIAAVALAAGVVAWRRQKRKTER